jgi:heme exporter protein C
MKFLLMLLGTGVGLWLGFRPSITARKPAWWRALTVVSVLLVIAFGIIPPIGGSIADAILATRADHTKTLPLALVRTGAAEKTESGMTIPVRDVRGSLTATLIARADVATTLAAHNGTMIVNVRRAEPEKVYVVESIVALDPIIMLPYVLGLEERARIMFFHVPMSWVAVVAYLIAMVYAIRYLRTRDLGLDRISMAASSVGTLYTVLATLTGAVWAKFNWGSFWNWDPRETSIFVLLLIYAAYFLLRSSIQDPATRARLSAAYSIVAFITVPFFIFVLPRLMSGLHPGSADDSTNGPLLDARSDVINPVKQFIFSFSLFAFTLVFFWLVNLRVRLDALLERRSVLRHQTKGAS